MAMKTVLHSIDLTSEWTAKIISWLSIALVLVLVFDVVERYVFGGATIWAYETGTMLGGTIYVMGWAFIHRMREHIRVDVFYTRLSPRVQLITDIIGTLIFLLPLLYFLIDTSIYYMLRAWRIDEVLPETFWYPPAFPFRTMVATGLFLFAFQTIANLIRDFYQLITNKAYD
jgi:TRAP-type mannitol/chloroaromatic compound transport system permease small subunit